MANKITDDCIRCGACEAECTNQGISQGDTVYVIDSAECDECKPGDSWAIPGGAQPGAAILADSVAIEVFSPVREDYLPRR